ncbi:hypothetical protein Gorai_008819, partial [Gossypium raimondii]|nr:hypothetical protein [Gossypium raimondii]
MESKLQLPQSVRLNRRGDRNNQRPFAKDDESGLFSSMRLPQDNPTKIVWKQGFIRLVLVAGILWMLLILIVLLFHVWSCQSSISFLSAMCNKEGKVFIAMDLLGLAPKPEHRCPIPVADDPDKIVIPKGRTPDAIVKNLTYIEEEDLVNNGSQSFAVFGGNQSWLQREENFNLKPSMKVHCGFLKNGGADLNPVDIEYVKRCRFLVASGIFDGYDVPHQPSN